MKLGAVLTNDEAGTVWNELVIPGVADYTDQAEAAFKRFSDAGMHVTSSSDPIETLPGIAL